MFKRKLGMALLPLLLFVNTCYADANNQQIIPANNMIPQANLTLEAAQVSDAVFRGLLQDIDYIVFDDDNAFVKSQLGFNWNNNIP